VGMLSQLLMTARLWAQQEPWAALTATFRPVWRLLSMITRINARHVSN
jgi:hypothetical protein